MLPVTRKPTIIMLIQKFRFPNVFAGSAFVANLKSISSFLTEARHFPSISAGRVLLFANASSVNLRTVAQALATY